MSTKLTDKLRLMVSGIPTEVKHFMIKGAVLFVGWCLLYGLLLKPYDLIDPVLTKYTGKGTMWLMQYFYQGQQLAAVYGTRSVLIYIQNKEVLSIWDPCNGLDLYVLFTGFVFCVPMDTKKKITYLILGVASIFILNILRCLALASLFYYHFTHTDIAHHYVFQLIVYAAIFFIWERYFRSLKKRYEVSKI